MQRTLHDKRGVAQRRGAAPRRLGRENGRRYVDRCDDARLNKKLIGLVDESAFTLETSANYIDRRRQIGRENRQFRIRDN